MKSKKKKDLKDARVFVHKPGKKKEFELSLQKMVEIHNGELGWKGHAELLKDLGVFKGSIKNIENKLKKAMFKEFMEYADLLTEEEHKVRVNTEKVLYGNSKIPTTG